MSYGTIASGMLAGGLHALAGPDHIAVLLPLSCGSSIFSY